MGVSTVKVDIQINDVDPDLRVEIWNMLCELVWPDSAIRLNTVQRESHLGVFPKRLWVNYYKKPVDELSYEWHTTEKMLKKYFFSCRGIEFTIFLSFLQRIGPKRVLLKENSSQFVTVF